MDTSSAQIFSKTIKGFDVKMFEEKFCIILTLVKNQKIMMLRLELFE
jgi:hypothetical protein